MTALPSAEIAADGKASRLEPVLTWGIVVVLVLVSTLVTLACASPEFCWDEVYYVESFDQTFSHLWAHADYARNGHGVLMFYLGKLGTWLPASLGSVESRFRFFDALVASCAVGVIYASLRHLFQTSRAAALVGAGMFLFSGSRVEETQVIGPHALVAVCTVALASLGYYWRNRPSVAAALVLGGVLAYGALAMTYVVPIAVGWAFATAVAGKGWFGLDRGGLRVPGTSSSWLSWPWCSLHCCGPAERPRAPTPRTS